MKKQERKIVAIIQARMGSTRLPGKMMMSIEGKPLLWHVINRVKKSKMINEVVLATTIKKENKILMKKAQEYGINAFAGSENDVLDRFYKAAKKFNGNIIVRLTGDCPLIDAKIIDKTIKLFMQKKADYASNVVPPTFPDGLDVEVFSFKVLEKMWKTAKKKHEREHVTAHIREHPNAYKIGNLKNKKDLSHLRFTIDNIEDLQFMREIFKHLKNDFGMNETVDLLKKHPEIADINKKYERHDGYSGWKKFWKKDMEKASKKYKKSLKLLEVAKKIIPTAAQTYSKSYKYFCEGVSPVFLEKGKGSHVRDIDGNEFIDFVCALGPVTVGYCDKRVNNAIKKQLEKGMSFTLPIELEVKLAKKIIEIIPCAEMVKFVKNGADATTACIRLARAYTGREIVAMCGYHGGQDWSIGTTDNDRGVPECVKKLTKVFKYNDIKSLEKIFSENKGKVAAVILEPCQGNGPENNFLQKIKALTHKNKAVLIFDEVVSGFRMALGGAQEYYKVVPDLSAFGKGMGNGTSTSAFAGKKEIMKLIDEGAFISTTFGGEATALAASLETIKILENKKAFKHILNLGDMWKGEVQKLIDKKGLNDVVEVHGITPHCGVIFKPKGSLTSKDFLSAYQQTLTEKGILSIGINNFCLSHTKKDVMRFIDAVDIALDKVKEAVKADSLDGILKGEKFRPVFKR